MHIGLIGGIGPAGTITYYRVLTRLQAETGRALSLTIAHANLRDMLAKVEAGDARGQAGVFARYVDELRTGGCEAVAVAAVAAHFCIAELEAVASLPIVNAITALDAYFTNAGLRRIGVLGTRSVMNSQLYGIASVEVIAPPPGALDEIHRCYTAMSVAGVATPEQGRTLQEAGRALCRDGGAEAVLLGGTDLSLAFDPAPYDYRVLDAAAIHAEAIARQALA